MSEPHPTYTPTNGTIPGAVMVPATDERREHLKALRRHAIALVRLCDAELGYEQTIQPRQAR